MVELYVLTKSEVFAVGRRYRLFERYLDLFQRQGNYRQALEVCSIGGSTGNCTKGEQN
jgi:hypothetical protein